jgi:hypothetical protein
MVNYTCDCCKFTTPLKGNYSDHLLTKKHIRNIQTQQASIKPKRATPTEVFTCKYCDQKYKHSQSLNKHIKYSCTKNKTEDLTELVRLMNLQMETHRQLQSQIQSQSKQIENQNKQIEKLKGKLEIHGSFNTTNIQNIQLLNYKDTDVSHLTDNDYRRCIKKVCYCVMNLIETVHFNPNKPENMNIYISNMKDKYLMVYEDGKWILKNKKELGHLYEDKELMLEQWIEDNKDPQMDQFFRRYLDLKKDNETMLHIQDELKLMMFNKKNNVDKLPDKLLEQLPNLYPKD